MKQYGGCIPLCGSMCIDISYYIAVILIASAAVLYAIVKILQDLLKIDTSRRQEKNKMLNFLPMIAVIAQMDLLYTIATSRLTGADKLIASGILLIMTIIIGFALIVGKAIKLWKENEQCQWNEQIDDKIKRIEEKIETKDDDNNNNPFNKRLEQDIKEIDKWELTDQLSEVNRKKLDESWNKVKVDILSSTNTEKSRGSYKHYLSELHNSLKVQRTKHNRQQCIVIIVFLTLISFSLAFNTLGDNLEPLDSFEYFMCTGLNPMIIYNNTGNSTEMDFTETNIYAETDSENFTENCIEEDSCKKNSWFRLAMGITSLILVLIPICYCYRLWLTLNPELSWSKRNNYCGCCSWLKQTNPHTQLLQIQNEYSL